MPVSLKDFAKSLAASGLMSADEIRDFLSTFPSEKRPKSTRDLAREIIRAGKITKYQAEEVYHGRTKGLVLGNYVILDKIGAGGMGQVFKAQHGRMKRMSPSPRQQGSQTPETPLQERGHRRSHTLYLPHHRHPTSRVEFLDVSIQIDPRRQHALLVHPRGRHVRRLMIRAKGHPPNADLW